MRKREFNAIMKDIQEGINHLEGVRDEVMQQFKDECKHPSKHIDVVTIRDKYVGDEYQYSCSRCGTRFQSGTPHYDMSEKEIRQKLRDNA